MVGTIPSLESISSGTDHILKNTNNNKQKLVSSTQKRKPEKTNCQVNNMFLKQATFYINC